MKNVEDIYTLTPVQEGILFHSLYTPESSVYVIQLSYVFEGDLDTETFDKAWQRVVDRHPILRTSFLWEGLEHPVQVVHRRIGFCIDKQDWRDVSPSEQESRLESYLQTDRNRGFELSAAPLMRVALIQLADNIFQFLWSFHHLLLDAWSFLLVRDEAFAYYEAKSREIDLSRQLPRPFRDYIAWLKQQDLAEAEVFWRRELAGCRAPSSLPVKTRQLSPEEAEEDPGDQHVTLSVEETEDLLSLARDRKLTLHTLAQGAWAVLMSRYTNEKDIIFGITMSGRPAELKGVEDMVGLFINTLPSRVHVPPEAELWPWLGKLQKKLAEIRHYEYCPLTDIQGWSGVPRSEELFESVLVFEADPVAEGPQAWIESLKVREIQVFQRSHYSLVTKVVPGKRLTLSIEYDKRKFEAETIKRMLGHFKRLLEAMVSDPVRRLSDLPMLTDTEYRQAVSEWNETETPYLREKCVHELFETQAALTPDAAAICSGDRIVSYGELERRSNLLARYLCGLGVGPEVAVGLCAERTPEMVIGILGILKSGGVYVPLDPSYPRARMSFMLSDVGSELLLTTQDLLSGLPAVGVKRVCLDTEWPEIEGDGAGYEMEETGPLNGLNPSNAAYVIYTSGSTGRPKGVLVDHRSLVNYVSWSSTYYAVRGSGGSAVHSSIGFDLTITSIFPSLVSGEVLVLVPEAAGVEGLGEAVRERSGFGLLKATPSHLGLLREQLSEEAVLRSADVFVIGGEALRGDQVSLWQETGSGARLINEYGPTEAVVGCCTYEVRKGEEYTDDVPIGRPISNARLYILDDLMNPVPVGVGGELYIGGEVLARGYVNRADLTSSSFVPDPFVGGLGCRMYRTGDRVRYRSDGTLLFLGRDDDQVKVRGYRIELGEIESVLQDCSGVREAVVTYRGDGGEGRLVGYVVPEEGLRPTVSDLREELLESLPEYMLPSVVVFLEAFPLTAHGKVDRAGLPDPEGKRPELGSAFTPPRSAEEKMLAEIWAELLEVDRVGIHDNFFELEGHSLIAIRVLSRIRRSFNISLPLRTIFDVPTIAELAKIVADEKSKKAAAEVPRREIVQPQPRSNKEILEAVSREIQQEGEYGEDIPGADGKDSTPPGGAD